MPVAAPGASRWRSTTARLNSPGQPHPSANATNTPATNGAGSPIASRAKPPAPATSSATIVEKP